MKILYVMALLGPVLFHPKPVPTPIQSKIDKVIVYRNGAQVTRVAQLQLQAGNNRFVLGNLSADVDENTIQIAGLSGVSMEFMEYDINYIHQDSASGETKVWLRTIDTLQKNNALAHNRMSGLEEEEKVIVSNRFVNGKNQTLDLENLRKVSVYYRNRITEIKNSIYELNESIQKNNEKIEELRLQLSQVSMSPKVPQGEIKITLNSPIPRKLQLILNYQVKEAGWVPHYDIRSEKHGAPLEIIYKASVFQDTGEDWQNVALSLSTAEPRKMIQRPTLSAKYLNFSSLITPPAPSPAKSNYVYNPLVKQVTGTVTDQSGLPLPGANVTIKGSTRGTQTDFDGKYSLEVNKGSELSYTYLGQKPVSVPVYASIMNIQMEEDAQALDEVVVVGYVGKSQRMMTGAVSAVTSESLQGRTSGVTIRGISSPVQKVSTPLFVIDGVPVPDFEPGDLDESEIQDIHMLDQVEASSIYGQQASAGVVLITTKRINANKALTHISFEIKDPQTVVSDGDIQTLILDKFEMKGSYQYYAVPLITENVFLTASFKGWESYQLLPGEANIYYEGAYSGKSVIDPYITKKEMTLSLGTDPNISVERTQERNFKSKSFTGSNRIFNRTYILEVKNNRNTPINISLMDRIPISQNREIKVDDIITGDAQYDANIGLLNWVLDIAPGQNVNRQFSYQVKHPRERRINL